MKHPKTRKQPDKPTGFRLYHSADIYVDQLPTGMKVVTMRFHTAQDIGRGGPDSTTPWVTFSLEMFEGLASQMAEIAAAGKSWNPGDDTSQPDIGNVEGITAMRIPKAD